MQDAPNDDIQEQWTVLSRDPNIIGSEEDDEELKERKRIAAEERRERRRANAIIDKLNEYFSPTLQSAKYRESDRKTDADRGKESEKHMELKK